MRAHSFITLVSLLDGAPFASHVPVVVRRENDVISLHGHLARANSHWRAFDAGESLAMQQGLARAPARPAEPTGRRS